jgi:ATP-binding cassette subfamily F protein uup
VGLGQWEAWHQEQSEAEVDPSPKPKPTTRAAEPARRKLSYKDQRDFDTIEERIAQAEAALFRLRAEQESPEVASHAARLIELEGEIATAQAEVDALYARWDELETLRSSF